MSTLSKVNTDPSATTTTNVFSIEDLFYIPLKAVIDANTQASLSAVDIIKKYGFDHDKTSPNYGKLKMVEFSYNYVGKNGLLTTMSVSIPFITLIPLPLLEVKQAKVEIAAQILAKMDINTQKGDVVSKKNQVLAVLSPVTNVSAAQASIQANINISVDVAQSDLPAGMLKLINLGQEAVIGGQLADVKAEPAQVMFRPGKMRTVTVSFEVVKSLPPNPVFTVIAQPSTNIAEGAFMSPIQINVGYLVGEAQPGSIQVIPEITGTTAKFELTFWAGHSPCNGFINIMSDYSYKQSIYFNIQK